MPATRHRIEQVIDRSRFLCTLAPAPSPEEAQLVLRAVREEFPGATHHCVAWVCGAPGTMARIGASDDGEPHGTAGRPMLNVLLHAELGDVVAVVTRWYGGVKLGTGGLARAYSGAVVEALRTVPTAERIDALSLALTVEYSAVGAVQQLLSGLGASITAQQFGQHAQFEVRVDRSTEAELRARLADITRGGAQVHRAGADAGAGADPNGDTNPAADADTNATTP